MYITEHENNVQDM